jgi:hypothetical protein
MEKRRNKRVKFLISSSINGLTAEIIDISRTGLRISTYSLPPTNDLKVTLKFGKETMNLKGVTHWIEKKDQGKGIIYELGVSIVDAPDEYYNLLEAVLSPSPPKKNPFS